MSYPRPKWLPELLVKTGDFVDADLDLLRHEIFESKFEGIFKTDYRNKGDATLFWYLFVNSDR